MKAVLAYSGGLDTSVCVRLLQERHDLEVVTVTVDVGFSESELSDAEKKATKLGAEHYTIDSKKEFVEKYIFPSIKANGMYEGYPLSTALARPLIAQKVVEIAKKEGAEILAHGATGKGNDQFRFESVFNDQAPEMEIIAPIREGDLTRKESVAYAKKHGIPLGAKKKYSIDENLWGRSVEGGSLEDPSRPAPDDVYEWTQIKKKGKDIVEIGFESGVPVSMNSEELGGVELIETLNSLAGSYGVGRIDIIEDRILGIKARENYECPAAVVLLAAHRDLERMVLTREELRFKEIVEPAWGELVYRGLWNAPSMVVLDSFIEKTQNRVSGNVKVELREQCFSVVGRDSKNSLYSEEAASFENSSMIQDDEEGKLSFHSFQESLFESLRKKD
jgi:argininosuccinate synthase